MSEQPTENIPVWERLDYSCDAIIEASAGTGKTYAMQNIVLRLICDHGFTAPQILVVTFTDKAAGEIKSRIRQSLLDAGRLTADFDEMTICTIHSFCKRIIDEYAFESGMPMRSDICSSTAELYKRAANDAIRDDAFRAAFEAELNSTPPDNAPSFSKIVDNAMKNFGDPKELKEHEDFLRAFAANPSVAASDGGMNTLFRSMIHSHCDAIKSAEGILTYDDLVTIAADVVTGRVANCSAASPIHSRLIESIRRRYRVALVDEFQDTDAHQWEIFRTLFSSASNKVADCRDGFLIVVGDPKQAIYSFRGADVAVYCSAREEISALSHTPPLTLGETYRSTRSLVDAFNALFGGNWFADGAAGDGIGYTAVKFPAANPKFEGLAREDEIAPVMLLESMPDNVFPGGASAGKVHFGNKDTALPIFANSAALEMLRLRRFSGGSAAHPLRFTYGDMCVLVGTNKEAAIVRGVLARHGIPYAQYKQKGIFASAEAEAVIALFDFLARPAARGRRQALLISPLFAIHPSALDSLSEDFETQFNALVERLADFAARCDWVRLFECVMNAECSALSAPDGDISAFNRLRSAVRQIFDALLTNEKTRKARSCSQLADALRQMRENDNSTAESGSLYERESAADRVQIMTMHASKGLQFPIVFVATGFSPPKKDSPQERRRLLYVAITRAEHRVYLPWSRRAWDWSCEVTSTSKKGKVQTKIVEGYGIGSKGSELFNGGFLADAIMRYAESHGRDLFPADEPASTMPAEAAQSHNSTIPQCQNFPIASLWNRRLHWESFTSLQEKLESGEERDDSGEREYHEKSLAPSLLPRSNISGNVFHEVMETLCKNDEANGDVGFTNAHLPDFEERLRDVIRRAMRRNALANQQSGDDSTEQTLLRMVRTALAAQIRIGEATIILSQIPRRDRLAEVDFVLGKKFEMFEKFEGSDKLVLNGKIDLIIRIGNKAYIIDWKTNSLSDYSPEKVAEAMDDANYHLQYKLYALAANEWLRPRGLTLAGAAYLFVRGSGIFATEKPFFD